MLKRQACAKFLSQIFDESEVIQILKVVRLHFCQVYIEYIHLVSCITCKNMNIIYYHISNIILFRALLDMK